VPRHSTAERRHAAAFLAVWSTEQSTPETTALGGAIDLDLLDRNIRNIP
jgi:hypothetical protein